MLRLRTAGVNQGKQWKPSEYAEKPPEGLTKQDLTLLTLTRVPWLLCRGKEGVEARAFIVMTEQDNKYLTFPETQDTHTCPVVLVTC